LISVVSNLCFGT